MLEKATNGQFRELIGKLLVKGSDEKVALIDKIKIQNAINSLNSEDAVMDNFIHFLNNGCVLKSETSSEKSVSKTGRSIFTVEVDGTKTLEQLIADGKYDWKNSDIKQKNYPIKNITKRTAEIKLFHFGRYISSENAIKEMEKEDFRPATIEELLALGAKEPELQRQFPIIALGSVCKLELVRYVPVLYVDDDGRFLRLNNWGGGWRDYYRFVAVRKNS